MSLIREYVPWALAVAVLLALSLSLGGVVDAVISGVLGTILAIWLIGLVVERVRR
jgi:hypothetical protein